MFEVSFENTSASLELWVRHSTPLPCKSLLVYQVINDLRIPHRKETQTDEWPERPVGYKAMLEDFAHASAGNVRMEAYTDFAQLFRNWMLFYPQ